MYLPWSPGDDGVKDWWSVLFFLLFICISNYHKQTVYCIGLPLKTLNLILQWRLDGIIFKPGHILHRVVGWLCNPINSHIQQIFAPTWLRAVIEFQIEFLLPFTSTFLVDHMGRKREGKSTLTDCKSHVWSGEDWREGLQVAVETAHCSSSTEEITAPTFF